MKVFVWDKFACDHDYGMAVAVAEDVHQARKAIRKKIDDDGFISSLYANDLAQQPEVYDLSESRGFYIFGGG